MNTNQQTKPVVTGERTVARAKFERQPFAKGLHRLQNNAEDRARERMAETQNMNTNQQTATGEGNAPRVTKILYSEPYRFTHTNGSIGLYIDEIHEVTGGGYCPETYKYANIPFNSDKAAREFLAGKRIERIVCGRNFYRA